VPVAVIGAEEEAPLLASPRWLARLVGTPVAPLTPTLFVPAPTKYRIHFGAPLRFRGAPTAEVVARHVASVRSEPAGAHSARARQARSCLLLASGDIPPSLDGGDARMQKLPVRAAGTVTEVDVVRGS